MRRSSSIEHTLLKGWSPGGPTPGLSYIQTYFDWLSRLAQASATCRSGSAQIEELRVHIGGKVLERLATSDKTSIIIEKQRDGKMRVTSGSWDGEKIFL
jgi:hypothetical protein